LVQVRDKANEINDKLQKRLGILLQGDDDVAPTYRAPTQSSGGRPSFVVTRRQLERLLSFKFTKTKISELLGISRTTLWRRLNELQLEQPYSDISNEQLNDLVKIYQTDHPYTGQ